VTLSHVKMSPDLRHARISFTVLDEKDAKYSAKALNKASHFFRKHIAKHLELRVVPDLFFVYDKELHDAEDLVALINHL
jgi:ribosome-binding factor A